MSQSATGGALAIRVSIIAALAGLLFGLDIAYVNGSLDLISKTFHLTTATEGSVAGTLLIGAAIGALFSGALSRKFGRKKVLVLASLIFTLFILLGVVSPTLTIFLISRFIVGLAVGIASFVAPLYLSEVAPPKIRGGLIAMYQFMITIGIFLMFLSNSALRSTNSWRVMLVVVVIPAAIMLIGCITLPESPRWFILQGRDGEAEIVLTKIRNSQAEVDLEMSEMKETAKDKSNGMKLLKHKWYWKVLILGALLQAFQQFTGMNAFMYYSTQIFQQAGFANPAVATIVVGLVNMLTTILAIKYVDKFGRKPILYFGLTLLFISAFFVGVVFKTHYHVMNGVGMMHLSAALQWSTLFFCLLFIFGFAISMGPIIWILCSEIQPLEGRDLGITVSTMTNWICNAILGTYAVIWLTYHPGNTFFAFGAVCVICIFFTMMFVPETKGVTLEEMELKLRRGEKLKNIGA